MKQKIKTILQTLMAVTVILFVSGIWYVVSAEKNEALHAKQELEIQEVVETLEAITTHTLPNFERSNNQTFINSTVACVDYIYNMACNMGGMGFIENNKAECMLSVLINTNLLRSCLKNKIQNKY